MHIRTAMLVLTMTAIVDAAAADRESVFRGKRNAEINCGPCHAVAQSDSSTNAAAPPLRELSTRTSFATLRRDMAGPLFRQHAVMPDFVPTIGQVSDLMNYIESIQNRNR
jgi:mono/diheme cytochrome c family protein